MGSTRGSSKPQKTPPEAVPGVEKAGVRGRWMGRSLVLEVEGQVAANLSVAEANALGGPVEDAVHDAVDEARRIVWIPRPARAMADRDAQRS